MKRKILIDLIYNIFAASLPILVLQFIILPMTALELSSSEYGVLIALISWIYMVSLTLGSVINNIRLIENNKYLENNLVGDFNLILLLYLIINFVVVTFGYVLLSNTLSIYIYILIILTSSFLLVKNYIVVEFRLNLNFKLILYDGIIMVFGYFVGYLFFYIFDEWVLIYFFSSIFSILFVLSQTKLIQEPYIKTERFSIISKKSTLLLISVLLNSVTVYLDKIILLPLLGGSAVTIYYISTITGKVFSLILNPVSNVILSYLSRMKVMKNSMFSSLFIISIILGVFSYFILIYVSEFILGIIYPDYVEKAMLYVPVTILTAIVIAVIGVINPILLRFKSTMWQILINAIYLVIYISLATILLNVYGLIGFCYGLLLAAVLKLFLTLIIFKYDNSRYLLKIINFLGGSKNA